MNRRRFLSSSAAFAALATIPACTKSKFDSTRTLTVFTWADYLSDLAKEGFEEEFNCRLIIDTFDSNEAMLAKLDAGATGYDVLIPSSYTVQTLKRRNLIQPLDESQIPNINNIDKSYLKRALDSTMEYSVPYMGAPTCLAYLASKVSDPARSWKMLERADLKGRITLLDDMREVLGAALKLLGFSLNSTEPNQLAQAADVAIRWKANAAKFENEQYKTGIASGEFLLVQGYAGDLIQVSGEAADLRIFIPEEGSAFSCDDICISTTAKSPELAHELINYLCDAKVAAENMELIGYRAPNEAAYAELSAGFRKNDVLFPPAELFAKCEPIGDLGDDLAVWTKAWDRVKNS